MEWVSADHNTGEVEFNNDVTFAFINHYMEDDEVPKYTVMDMGEHEFHLKLSIYITECSRQSTSCWC